jgi:hypothetical protein
MILQIVVYLGETYRYYCFIDFKGCHAFLSKTQSMNANDSIELFLYFNSSCNYNSQQGYSNIKEMPFILKCLVSRFQIRT